MPTTRPPLITVLSRAKAARYRPAPGAVAISITNPTTPPAVLEGAYAAVLRLAFDDIPAARTADDVPFSIADATRVLAFVRHHLTAPELVIHCEMGASRSPGLALGLCDALGWPADELERQFGAPNGLVRTLLRRAAAGTTPSAAAAAAPEVRAAISWIRSRLRGDL